ncbi:MAG: DUF4280 domain-containing protein [Holosporales bacterium]
MFETIEGAMIMCNQGSVPTPLVVIPNTVMIQGMPAAVITNSEPFLSIEPFGICQTLTEAAGVPVPCVPVTTVWAAGSPTVLIAGIPMLEQMSQLMCAIGGEIDILFPMNMTVMIP